VKRGSDECGVRWWAGHSTGVKAWQGGKGWIDRSGLRELGEREYK
jgi:hypothetical protein